MGVIGMNLAANDEVIGMQLDSQGEMLLAVSEKGMGKCTNIDEFTVQNRGGKGVKCYKITEKTGNIIGVKAVNKENEIMMITTEGIIIRMPVAGISVLSRVTSGVKLMNLEADVKVASLTKVREADTKDEDEPEEEAEGLKPEDITQLLEESGMEIKELHEGPDVHTDEKEMPSQIQELLNRAEEDTENEE